jgi:nucleoside-triphosphatase
MPIKGRIAITGRPGVGKTTLIARVLERIGGNVGGMTTAHVHHRNGPKVGRYTVDTASLERIGVSAILDAVRTKELVVIDEIAPMELSSPAFVPAVEAALASDRALLISTHANADHPLAHRVRRELRLFRVKLGNRDDLVDEIVNALRSG